MLWFLWQTCSYKYIIVHQSLERLCESESVCTHTDVYGSDLQWHKIGAFTAYKIISELSVCIFEITVGSVSHDELREWILYVQEVSFTLNKSDQRKGWQVTNFGLKVSIFHQHCFNCHNLILTFVRTSDITYCVFSNPELYEVIYCVASYPNTYNLYKKECVRPIKKFHSMYLLMTLLSLVTETSSYFRQGRYPLSSGSLKTDSHKRINKGE